MKTIDVLVVDDHQLVRQVARTLLGTDPQVRVVGEACNGIEALSLAEQLQPQVILMDIAMPKMNGIEATLAIHEKWPSICVILITGLTVDTYREISQVCGARAFLAKEEMRNELLPTLYRAIQAC
jgi:two-component system NarL family response regulator